MAPREPLRGPRLRNPGLEKQTFHLKCVLYFTRSLAFFKIWQNLYTSIHFLKYLSIAAKLYVPS